MESRRTPGPRRDLETATRHGNTVGRDGEGGPAQTSESQASLSTGGRRARPTGLLKSLALGDAGTMERLYDTYAGRAYALASRILSSPSQAEDALQDALITVWKTSHIYDSRRGSEAAWVLTIVRNRALDRRRSERRREARFGVSLDEPNSVTSRHDTAAAALIGLDVENVRHALTELPPEQRHAIELAYFGGLTHVEMAARLALPLGTIKGRLRLGLEKLALALRSCGQTSSFM